MDNKLISGLVQGMVTGMRGLCNGLGPAMFGVIFYLFHVDLNDDGKHRDESRTTHILDNATAGHADSFPQVIFVI